MNNFKKAYPFNLTSEQWRKELIDEMQKFGYSKDKINGVLKSNNLKEL